MDGVLLGKYGAVVAYEENVAQPESCEELPENVSAETLPRQLCQHIIGLIKLDVITISTFNVIIFIYKGMNPQTIDSAEGSNSDEETALLKQEFVASPEYKVEEILQSAGWKVHGFLRFQCGE